MARLAPVSKHRHAGTYWQRFTDVSFAAQTSMAPLVARELPMAALNFPTAFALEEGRYSLVGLFSLFPGHNLFVGPDGKWLADYLPAVFRCHPFSLARQEDSDHMVLCVDEDSGLVGEDKKERFFDPVGELDKSVKDILEFLQQLEQNRHGTRVAVAALADAGLVVPWEIKAKAGEQEKTVEGIFRIDEEKLNKLDDDTFLGLRRVHALPVAYAQLLSMGHLKKFSKLARLHEPVPAPDIETLFGDDDIFRF